MSAKFQPGDIVEQVGKIGAWPFEGRVGVYVRKARLRPGHVIKVPHLGGTIVTSALRIRLVKPEAVPQAREYLTRWGLVDKGEAGNHD